ncbi:MAG: TrbI/VirB10 family protein [Cyanobacteria bacterium SIG30]|nr:TrbI/VirB10 family protein [Cyanobacteria bacterium SIG30]
MFKKIIFSFVLMLALSNFALANGNYSYTLPVSNNDSNYLKGQVIYVPQGVVANVVLSTALNSEITPLGSEVLATFVTDFAYNGKIIAPKGSVVKGTVINVEKTRRAQRDGEIMVRFNAITTPQNYDIAISAVIKTDDNKGVLKGGTKKDAAKDYALNTGIGAGSGAVLGTALGALSGGSVGKGAVYGTALGAGLGLIKGTTDKGNPVEIPAGATIQIYFDQPITSAAPLGNY